MKLTFLGTGTSQGVPVIGSTHPVCLSDNPKDKRLRTAAMLSWDNVNYVIDVGPDFRQQMLREKVQSIAGILITHEHTDHVIGLDDIRPFFFREKKDIPIFAKAEVFQEIKPRFKYIFDTENRYPGAPSIAEKHLVNYQSIELHGKKITPIEVTHGNLPILSFKIGNAMYCTDVKTIPEASLPYFENLDVLVLNALREEAHWSHLTLEEALDFITKIKPKKAYLTHISHLLGFHDEVEKSLPENVHLAYDGLVIDF